MDQDQEICGISAIDWDTIPWVRSTFLHDTAVELPTAKVCVFSDSVLCLRGRIAEYPRSVKSWKDNIDWFAHSPEHRELDGVDGKPVVFQWNMFQGTPNRTSSRRCTTTSIGDKEETKRIVLRTLQMLLHPPQTFPRDIGHPFTFTVITWNRESNCTCREKNHSQFQYETLT